MTTAVLERSEVVVPPSVGSEVDSELEARLDFAMAVQAALGYSHFLEVVEGDPRIRHAQGQQLCEAVASLNLRPFTQDSVDRHKQARLQQQQRSWRNRLRRGVKWLAVSITASGVLMAIGSLVVQALKMGRSVSADHFFFGLGVASIGAMAFAGTLSFPKWQWSRQLLNGYDSEVPERVLAQLLEIVPKLPRGTQVFVESLVDSRGTADPLVGVQFGVAEFYLWSWDEPSFEEQVE